MPSGGVTPAGGGSQTLAQVLTAGGDPDGHPVTGQLKLTMVDEQTALWIEPSGFTGGPLVYIAENLDVADDDPIQVRMKPSGGSYQNVFLLDANGMLALEPPYAGIDPLRVRVFGSDTKFRVDDSGATVISQTSAPADANLNAGDLGIWFDQTNGAAKVMFKGKSANGTVVTGEVALA